MVTDVGQPAVGTAAHSVQCSSSQAWRPPPSPPVGPPIQQHALHRRHQRDAHGARQAGRQRVVHPPTDVAQQPVHLLDRRGRGRAIMQGQLKQQRIRQGPADAQGQSEQGKMLACNKGTTP